MRGDDIRQLVYRHRHQVIVEVELALLVEIVTNAGAVREQVLNRDVVRDQRQIVLEHRERLLTGYRNGDVLAPNLGSSEALRAMAIDFIESIVDHRAPLSDGHSGYRVVRLLEMAQQSMTQQGRPVEVSSRFVGSSAASSPLLAVNA